jgi:hypothetical protein
MEDSTKIPTRAEMIAELYGLPEQLRTATLRHEQLGIKLEGLKGKLDAIADRENEDDEEDQDLDIETRRKLVTLETKIESLTISIAQAEAKVASEFRSTATGRVTDAQTKAHVQSHPDIIDLKGQQIAAKEEMALLRIDIRYGKADDATPETDEEVEIDDEQDERERICDDLESVIAEMAETTALIASIQARIDVNKSILLALCSPLNGNEQRQQ